MNNATQKRQGPGDELAHIFHWFAQHPTPECPCERLRAQMNLWGPDGCLDNLDDILNVLEGEADRRKIIVPFRRGWLERFVRWAVYKARKAQREVSATR